MTTSSNSFFPTLSSDEDDTATASAGIVDTFPSRIFDYPKDLEEFVRLFLWSNRSESVKQAKDEAVPVIPFKADERSRVTFLNLSPDATLLSDRFDRLYDDARTPLLVPQQEPDWARVDRKLMKHPRLSHRFATKKNTRNRSDGTMRKGHVDERQSFVVRHAFLAKGRTTPGARTTGPEEYHLLQTHNDVSPLLYLFDRQQKARGIVISEGSFHPADQRYFRAYLPNPSAADAFFIGPDTTYVLLTLQKTCYAMTRVTSSLFENLQQSFTFQDAFSEENASRAAFLGKQQPPKPILLMPSPAQTNNNRKRKWDSSSSSSNTSPKSLDRLFWRPVAASTTEKLPQLENPSEILPPMTANDDEEYRRMMDWVKRTFEENYS